MRCSDLKQGDIVVFYVTVYAGEDESSYDGNVIAVYPDTRKVAVCYLEGYKSRSDIIPYEKMIAKYDKNGEVMKFGGWITGPSILLEAE